MAGKRVAGKEYMRNMDNTARFWAYSNYLVALYRLAVVYLRETIHLMGEADGVIEVHGGWPIG